MQRRRFIAGLGAAAAWPLVARAQQSTMPMIGFLSSRSPAESAAVVAAFREGLGDSGFVIDRNVAIESRWAEGDYARLPQLASELVGMKVAVILAAGGPPAALAAKQATSTIPIVFSAADDPVGLGLVESLGRPGGNITGMSLFNAALSAKRLQLLHELVPSAKTIAYLANPASPSVQIEVKDVLAAAKALAIDVRIVEAKTDQQIESAFAGMAGSNIGAVIVAGEPFFDSRRAAIVELAAKHAIPASYSWRENVALGGLLSYGTSITASYRDAGLYCSRILKGERPADLPVMQPTKFELTVNLKTARKLGLVIPPALLTGADEVIE